MTLSGAVVVVSLILGPGFLRSTYGAIRLYIADTVAMMARSTKNPMQRFFCVSLALRGCGPLLLGDIVALRVRQDIVLDGLLLLSSSRFCFLVFLCLFRR